MPDILDRPAPPWRADGTPVFNDPVHWLTFDAVKGVLRSKDMGTETDCMLCFVVHASLVRTLTAPGGAVICASDNQRTSSYGRRGQQCASCVDHDGPCRERLRIWVREAECGTLFAHTLSVTASKRFEKYADALQKHGRLPPEVITEVFVDEFVRKRIGLTYLSLQFTCASKMDTH